MICNVHVVGEKSGFGICRVQVKYWEDAPKVALKELKEIFPIQKWTVRGFEVEESSIEPFDQWKR